MADRSAVRLLLDTTFCLRLVGGDLPRLRRRFDGFSPGEIGISSLTLASLQSRVQRSSDPVRNQRALDQFLLPLVVVDFDTRAANRFGEIAGWWHGAMDAQIGHAQMLAAQAIETGAILVTCQPGLYAPAPGLQLDTDYAAVNVADGDWSAPLAARPNAALRRTPGTIVAIGSHDMTLELLGDSLHAAFPTLTLFSAHVGSLNGLLALQRNEAHLAGVHLLDPETGQFNVHYVERHLATQAIETVLLGFVTRVQGLIVARGNPKEVASLADLARDDVRFVNRQPAAGTRVLLDYHLGQEGIDPRNIQGYAREESSHLTVAMAVASGSADCGLGIQAAAMAHGLSFVPLFEERYDLAIPSTYFDGPLLAPLVDLLRHPSADFLQRVDALGGYGTAAMGQVIEIIPARVEASR